VVIWAAVVWLTLRPVEITSDWNGWRQADTQTIAVNYLKPGSQLLKPQISWGGDGPGYVETELQLYTLMASWLMRAVGPVEWAGQLLSLLAVVGTAFVLFRHLAGRYSESAAAAGVIAFIGVRTVPHLASVVMPDALALFFYALAWAAFYRYYRSGRGYDLVLYASFGAIAMLVKPTTSQLGIASFLLLLLGDPSKLRDRRVWGAWLAMLAVFGAYLAYAHDLYATYGNTFGLLFGEDSKRPQLRHLLMPMLYKGVLLNIVRWGLGLVGAICLAVLVVRRRVDAEHVALGVAGGILVFVAFRYMSQDAGNYYFAPMTLLAGALVAGCVDELGRVSARTTRLAVLGLLACGLALQVVRGAQIRHFYAHFDDPEVAAVMACSRQLALWTKPHELIVVRSPNEAFDVFWGTGRNYHDPRVFYLTSTRGWTLGREQGTTQTLEVAAGLGARFFVDPLAASQPELDAWLRRQGELVWDNGSLGRIWQLKSRTGSSTVE
jgi:4-amino-4-deoxy-L-arabinose transferase-like glycosyltransferase